MATSEHTDEVEIAVSVVHCQGPPSLENATENAGQPGASIPVLDTSNTTSPKRKGLSTSKTLGTFCDYYAPIQSLILNSCYLQ